MTPAPDMPPEPSWRSVRQVLAVVSAEFETPLSDLLSERRQRRLVRPRQAAMWLAREFTRHSLPTIGRAMRRDHTTVLHGIAAHQRRLETDPYYAACVARARAALITNPETPSA